MRIRKRYGMKEKQFWKDVGPFTASFGVDLRGSKFEIAETDGPRAYILDGTPVVLEYGDRGAGGPTRLAPALMGILKHPPSKRFVTVDSGAVRFLANGADVMAPGIVEADPGIVEGDVVWVREHTHGRPLSVGTALRPGASMVHGEGKAVEVFHYVGDRLWKLFE